MRSEIRDDTAETNDALNWNVARIWRTRAYGVLSGFMCVGVMGMSFRCNDIFLSFALGSPSGSDKLRKIHGIIIIAGINYNRGDKLELGGTKTQFYLDSIPGN